MKKNSNLYENKEVVRESLKGGNEKRAQQMIDCGK